MHATRPPRRVHLIARHYRCRIVGGNHMEYPTNSDDLIDSRQVIEAITEIEELLEEMPASGTEPDNAERAELVDQLTALQTFAKDAEEVSDWRYGETFIRDSYFKDYAIDLADDIGAVNRNADWPNNCIDWERAANELKQDYTPYEFDGVTYWARA